MADPINDVELHKEIQSKASKNVEAPTQAKKMDSDEEVGNQESIRKKLRSLIPSHRIDMCLKVQSISLSLGRVNLPFISVLNTVGVFFRTFRIFLFQDCYEYQRKSPSL